MLNRLLLVLVLVCGFVSESVAKKSQSIRLHDQLTAELNSILSATNDLHGSCVKGDEQAISTNLEQILLAIQRARQVSSLVKKHKRQHLVKILDSAFNEVEVAKGKQGAERRKQLVAAFAQIVNLAKIYQTESYKIFFCPQDRTLWLQKGPKPQNPFHPNTYRNCGVAVR
jgi:hypothetical protein